MVDIKAEILFISEVADNSNIILDKALFSIVLKIRKVITIQNVKSILMKWICSRFSKTCVTSRAITCILTIKGLNAFLP